MEGFLLDYSNLLLRWLHVIAAIAWIGESIYFVMLDLSLHKPHTERAKQLGVFGELWAVHGGGFYHNEKYLTNPAELPDDLHWSFWKAYTTWLSGFGLFVLMYCLNANIYLVNPASPWEWARNMSGTEAGILAVLFLVVGYNVYSRLCRIISPTGERDGLLSVAVGVGARHERHGSQPGGRGVPDRGLQRLFPAMPHHQSHREPRRLAERGRGRDDGVRVVAVHADLPGPRGLPAGGRDARHLDERQRVLLDHPRPAPNGQSAESR
jgi:hypothetical protein